MAQHDSAPAECLEDGFDLFPESFVHDAVEALAVIVDDPPCIAQVVLPAFLQALVDVAFVEFGVAHQRDHPAERPVCGPWLGFEIVLHDRCEGGFRNAEADRACGKVHIVNVLGAAGIGLRAAIAAKVLELLKCLIAHQVVHGVVDRCGMRFDGDTIFRAQCVEIERGHDRDHGGAGSLMTADLYIIVALVAQVVRIVDGPGRQPEQALLEGLEMIEFARHWQIPVVRRCPRPSGKDRARE